MPYQLVVLAIVGALSIGVQGAQRAHLQFSIWKNNRETGPAGVLMVRVNGSLKGNICSIDYRSSAYVYNIITLGTARSICQHLRYSDVEVVDKVGNVRDVHLFQFSDEVNSLICDLDCPSDDIEDCEFHYLSYGCFSWRYHTYLSCICDEGYHTTRNGCLQCPPGLTSRRGSNQCDCPAGTHWSTQGFCKTCSKNTYSAVNSTSCSACPAGSRSPPNSEYCNCTGGLYLSANSTGGLYLSANSTTPQPSNSTTPQSQNSTCLTCPDNHYSYAGSTTCTKCPGNRASRPYQAFCECAAGQYWSFTDRDCLTCPENYYSEVNATSCTACPDRSVSRGNTGRCNCTAGYKWVSDRTNTSDHCQICPNNYFSKFGARHCTQCPHFKASGPGSEYCYRCSLGSYWENHTCLPCPVHLYGDGIHCNTCPEGFNVDRGFCYKPGNGVLVYIAAVITSLVVVFTWKKRRKIAASVSGMVRECGCVQYCNCVSQCKCVQLCSRTRVRTGKVLQGNQQMEGGAVLQGTGKHREQLNGGNVHYETKSSDDEQRIYYVLCEPAEDADQ